ncbi:SDR family oxidoreductase [Dactylosporangium sp. NPDC000555]|uniref:SDR family NAD(P)-dependent oxidoreductase n=1 Tax=Dactylosporangium sp. NPDC000555 TaxID=3154260 RepID=UPI00332B04DB
MRGAGTIHIVAGAGTGIGRAVAAAFVEAGDSVVITGRRRNVLAATAADLGARARWAAFDATDPAQVAAALDELPSTVDVLVNNAGGNTDLTGGPTDSGEPTELARLAAAWRANLDANVLSAVLVTDALRPRLAPGGAVVNVSSIAAHRGGSGSYGAAKAAVEAWTLTLAQQLGPDRITANVVAPGYIADTEFFRDRMTPQREASLIAQATNGRAGVPGDVAAAVLFLASPAAGHITAQTIHVNGGAWAGR